jgi:hypothetical protein
MDKRIHAQAQLQSPATPVRSGPGKLGCVFFYFANPAATSSPIAMVRWPVGDEGEGSRLAPPGADAKCAPAVAVVSFLLQAPTAVTEWAELIGPIAIGPCNTPPSPSSDPIRRLF